MSVSDSLLTYQHHGMGFFLTKTETTVVSHAFVPTAPGAPGSAEEHYEYFACPPFQLATLGRQHGGLPAIATAQTSLPWEMKRTAQRFTPEGMSLTFLHEDLGLEVTVSIRGISGCAVVRSTTTVRNVSTKQVTLTHLSSAYVQGLALHGCKPWNDKNKLRVHYCRQTWAGEGQWRHASLEELGMYETAKHSTRGAVHLWSEGSWSTGRYQPMIVVEDLETTQVWYAQIETSSPWHFEIGMRGSIWEKGKPALYLQADGASDRYGGWYLTLQPGESFTSVPVAYGCCEGDFTDAVRELTHYRRTALKQPIPGFAQPPILFNDYMNCLFANQSREKLEPIIQAAASAGVEVFCMDAGWFTNPNAKGPCILGDWFPNDDKFGPGGVAGMLRFIKDAGMVPGLWLEMEVCGEDSDLGQRPDDWFLQVYGHRVGGGDRWFLNFTNEDVKEYLHNAIDHLVSLGVGYIKNDYNACIGLGDDVIGSSPADGLIRNARAFYKFIDEIRARHPQLILENCGCGAMRLDYGIQSHFHLASYSDQESYEYAPSILVGTLAAVLPEQLGIWAYPFPLTVAHKDSPEILKSPEYLAAQSDGEQTIFNMVNGLCGVICLSGRIDAADEFNLSLIQEGVRIFKDIRQQTAISHPIWPLGMPRIGDVDAWASVALSSPLEDHLLLAIWRRETSSEYCEIPLRGFAGCQALITQIYPTSDSFFVETSYNPLKGNLTVHFPKMNQARFFEVQKVNGGQLR